MKRAPLIALLTLLLLPAAASSYAQAQPLHTGFVDNAAFHDSADSTVGKLWLKRARNAGGRFARINVYWDTIAPVVRPPGFEPSNPGDPAYRWDLLDQSLRSVAANGLTPMLMAFLAPAWAEGPDRDPEARLGTWKPDPDQFAAFGQALVTRYSGKYPDPKSSGNFLPRVKFFQAWNEPNHFLYLSPQAEKGKVVSPSAYRTILNKFYSAVKSVRSDVRVLAAGLAPIGRSDNRVIAPKDFIRVIAPKAFIRRLTCMRTNSKPRRGCDGFIRADIWDHHPYTTGGPTHEAAGKDDVSLGDLPELRNLIRAGDKHRKIRGAQRRTPLWATEFSWDTKPDPGGLPMKLAKRWTAEALFKMWDSGVSVMTWLSILDAPASLGDLGWAELAQSGFYYYTDDPTKARAKASLRAFRFPFVAFKTRKGFRFWGRTPDSTRGRVKVQVRKGRQWRTVVKKRSDKNGIFKGSVRASKRKGFTRAIYQGKKAVPFSLKNVPDRYFRPFGGE